MNRSPSSPADDDARSAACRGTPPLDWPLLAGKVDVVTREIEAHARRRARRRIFAAASVAAVMVFAAVLWPGRFGESAHDSVRAPRSAIVAAPARQVLPDGTVVDLKTGTEIHVAFDAAAPVRRVVLRSGEAYFAVAKDPARPFVVEAGAIAVRAVGTEFSVEFGRSEVAVLVTEGRVAMDRPAVTEKATETLVDSGNRAVITTTTHDQPAEVRAVSSAEIADRLSWRVPRLDFTDTPLREIVALFNRHAEPDASGRSVRLVLDDPAMDDLPLSGVLRADNVSVLLQILETSYGITAEHQPSGDIVLRRPQ